jgi:hypothetical protein
VGVDERGVPAELIHVGVQASDRATGIELFVSQEAARHEFENDDFRREDGRSLMLRYVQGSELLDVIGCADFVDIHQGNGSPVTIVLTRNGARILEAGEVSSTDAALETLKEQLSVDRAQFKDGHNGLIVISDDKPGG